MNLQVPHIMFWAAVLCGCASSHVDQSLTQGKMETPEARSRPAPGVAVIPPPMPRRTIAPSANPPPGESVLLEDEGQRFTLFMPESRGAFPPAGNTLTVHFHGATWFVIQEFLRAGRTGPLLAVQLGEGSSVYRRAFEDRERFGRLLKQVERELKPRTPPVILSGVDISSFSAGYGAVRELIKSPDYFRLIQRIVLCDSLYASLDTNSLLRKPLQEHIEPWLPFVRAAMRGEKTFVLTHSEVPTLNYASSAECAAAIIKAVGAPSVTVVPAAIPASNDADFPLRYRSDVGNFHIWGYAGTNAEAHLTHVRHLADVWEALGADKTGARDIRE